MSSNYKDEYGTNTIKIIHKGKVISQASFKVQLGGGDVIDKPVQTNITYTDDDGKGLMHLSHQAIVVGESVAQVKQSTTAKITDSGTVLVSQLKSEISSRGEEVYFYDNSLGTWEGTLADARRLFPDVDFSGLQNPAFAQRSNPEFGSRATVSSDPSISWRKISSYDAEENGGKPTTWSSWADSLQTGLDIAGLIPGLGEIADCVNGCISLARGNYEDAALSFAAMVPGFGAAATLAKQSKKLKQVADNKGVYDLIIRNTDGLEQAYVGQSKNIFKRLKQHFGIRGRLGQRTETVIGGVTYKMPGSTKLEREIYEQFVILEKYRKNTTKSSSLWNKLLNKVNPVGGRFDLNTPQGRDKFYEIAEGIADKYKLPKTFKEIFN